jgi:hypothetical protein
MKKSLFLAAVLMVAASLPVFADPSTTDPAASPRLRPDRPGIMEIRQDVQTIGQDARSDIARIHAERLSRRFAFYYDRFTDIIARFQSRLDLLKRQGVNTSTAQTDLDLVKTKLAAARSAGDQAVAAFQAIDPGKISTEHSELVAARNLAVKARQAFVDVNTALKVALRALKLISKPALPAASAAVQNSSK